jgi:hypothetical protein
MGTTLSGTTPQNTYPSLIKVGDNSALTSTLKTLSDGSGNDSILALSTVSLQIGGSTGASWDNTNKRLGIGNATPAKALDVNGDILINGLTIGRGTGNRDTNVAVGFESLLNTTSGINNIALGYRTLKENLAGGSNIAIGSNSLLNNTSGGSNVAVGQQSLRNNVNGSQNTAIGDGALNGNGAGSNNSALGFFTSSNNFSGSVILGREATATANNQFVVGSSGTNAGAVTTAVAAQTKTWDVIINGVAQKILLA